MHKQKIITKWLVIIFLTTITVANYIFLTTFFKETNDNALSNSPSPSIPVDTQPYYSDFPRKGETLNGVQFLNIGGKNNETIIDSIKTSKSQFVLFYSTSSDYDLKKSGLNLAYISQNSLAKVINLADETAIFYDCKYCGDSIAVAFKDSKGSHLIKLNLEGNIIASTDFENASQAKFYLSSNNLMLFYIADNTLHYGEIASDFSFHKSSFIYKTQNCEIKEIFQKQSYQMLAINENENIFKILSFNKSTGFTEIFCKLNCQFMQIFTLPIDNTYQYYLLFKSSSNTCLQSYTEDFKLVSSTFIQNATTIKTIILYDVIIVVTPNGYIKICKHLDTVSAMNFEYNLGDIHNVTIIGENLYIVSNNNDCLMISRCDLKNQPLLLQKINCSVGKTTSFMFGNNFYVQLNSQSQEGLCYKNFGNADIFCLTF